MSENKTSGLLTNAEIQQLWVEHGLDDCAVEDFARAIEAAVLAKAEIVAYMRDDRGYTVLAAERGAMNAAMRERYSRPLFELPFNPGEKAAPQSPVAPADFRIETTYEHIARDMREGRFPARSEPQRVSVAPADDDMVREQVEKYERAEEKAFEASANSPRCQYCDGTGDVHSITGEWRGECPECKPVAPADELVSMVYRLRSAAITGAQAGASQEAFEVAVKAEDDLIRAIRARLADAPTVSATVAHAHPTGEQLYTMVTSRFVNGSIPWRACTDTGKAAWETVAAEVFLSPDTILSKLKAAPTPPTSAADAMKSCVCGQPSTLGVVHRADAPCFVYATGEAPTLRTAGKESGDE